MKKNIVFNNCELTSTTGRRGFPGPVAITGDLGVASDGCIPINTLVLYSGALRVTTSPVLVLMGARHCDGDTGGVSDVTGETVTHRCIWNNNY